MTSEIREHFHPSDDVLIAFTLDELDESLHEAVDAHIDECDHCQRQCAATNDTLALLALAAPPVAPPPHLRARVLKVPSQSPRVVQRTAAPSVWRTWLRPRRLVPAMLVAAAAALALALPQMTGSGTQVVALSNGAGAIQVTGHAARLATWNLGPAPAGHAYEVWVMRPGTAPRAVGLIADVTPLQIADVRAGDQIGVTVEPAAGSPGPTTASIATAQIV